MTEGNGTDTFRGASLTGVDLAGATFRDCDLRGVRAVDCWLVDVRLSGLVSGLVVNDVDVTAFVEGELDRRHPERAQARAMRTVEEHRAMWDVVEHRWSETVARARRLPTGSLDERVEGEWSFVETLRHLVFAADAWCARTILDEPMPYHRLGLPHSSMTAVEAAEIGVDLDARPSLDDVLAVRANRAATVRGVLAGLTDTVLERVCTRPPGPGYPDEVRTVRRCLGVIAWEECEHHRYAVRDLAILEARGRGRPSSSPSWSTGPPAAPRR